MALPRKLTEKQIRSAGRKAKAKKRARKKADRDNSCAGKIRHADRYGAIFHLKKLGNGQMGLYQCRFCKGWHIGHQWTQNKVQARLDQLLGN